MHFYDRQGNPMYEVPYSDKARAGEMRPSTLADARKNGWLPSVTEILGVIKDPGLEWWKIRTHIEAALTEPRNGRAVDDMIPSIKANAEEFSRVARDLGTAHHDAIEAYVKSTVDDTYTLEIDPRVPDATMMEFKHWYIDHGCEVHSIEKLFACEYGWAGRVDWVGHVDGMWTVIDWKTQGTHPGQPFKFYPKWAAQLAAYAYGMGHHIEKTNLLSVAISTTEPGRIDYKMWTDNRAYLTAFFSAFDLWKGPLGKNYDPLN